MILQKLKHLTIFTKQQYCKLPVSLFTQIKSNTEQESVDQSSEPAPHVQEVLNQTIDQAAQQAGHTKRQGFKKRGRFDRGDNNQARMLAKASIAEQFLTSKTPLPNLKQLFQQLQTIQDQKQQQQRIHEFYNKYQEASLKNIKKYQNKVGITPQRILTQDIKLNGMILGQQKNTSYIFKYLKNQTFKNLGYEQIKQNLANGYYRYFFSKDDIRELCGTVIAQKNRMFVLNILFEDRIGQQNKQKLLLGVHELNGVLDLVKSGEGQGLNLLKFYWETQKVNSKIRSDISSFILNQLKKIKINDKDASKQLKILSYFFLGSDLSKKIIQRICQITPNLSQGIKLWFLTMLVASRIKHIIQLPTQTNKLNISDILLIGKDNQIFKNYLQKQLPKLFFNSQQVHIFLTYKKCLKQKNNAERSQVGSLQKSLGLSFADEDISLEYINQKDFSHNKIWLRKKYQKPAHQLNSPEFTFIQNILKGQYQNALDYYGKKIEPTPFGLQKIYKYQIDARAQFNDPNSQALYVFKQLVKENQKQLQPRDSFISQEAFQKFFTQRQKGPFFSKNNENVQKQRKSKPFLREKSKATGESEEPVQKKFKKKEGVFKKTQKTLLNTPSSSFCSIKDKLDEQGPNKQQSNQNYQNYLKTIKQVAAEQKQQSTHVEPKLKIFDFSPCTSIEQTAQQFQKHLNEINQNNFSQILESYKNIPVVGNIKVLFKYFFFSNIPNSQKVQLKVQFTSSFGQIYKDYGEYLNGCPFMFSLPNQFYDELLVQIGQKNHRKNFKRIVAHILLSKKNIPDSIITKVCELCSKEKIGLTLLQIINLLNVKQIQISYEALKKIASSIQNFKNMESDLLNFIRKYCDRTNIKIQTKLFEPYITNLTFTENYQALNLFFDTLREQLKAKQYKINPKISAEQNLKAEKIYRQVQAVRINNQLIDMVKIVAASFKPRTKIPPFIIQIFEQYLQKKVGPLKADEYAVALIIYSQTQDKFLKLLEDIKAHPQQNTQIVLNAQIRSLLLFGKNLKQQVDKILKATLFEKQLDLDENKLKNFGYIFKQLDIPGPYAEFLEYILKKQVVGTHLTQQIKNLYYKIFNLTTDDFSKNQISGLLDYIFNPAKQKDRIQYRKVKQEEQRKSKLIKSIATNKQVSEEVDIKSQKKDKAQKKNQNESATSKEKKKIKKQQKKQKKEQKKSKSQGKTSADKIKVGQNELPQNTKVNPFEKRQKILNKRMAKLSTVLSYDTNSKPVYHQKLWKKDFRIQSTSMFIQSYLQKYEVSNQVDGKLGKDAKGDKNTKGGKETSKQPVKKSATKQKK